MYRLMLLVSLCLGSMHVAQAQSDVRLESKEYYPKNILMWQKIAYVPNYTQSAPKDLKQGLIKLEKWLKNVYSDDDYNFEVVTPGVTVVSRDEPRKVNGSMARTYRYHFPVSVKVTDGTGKLTRTFIISDDTTTFTKEIYSVNFKEKYEENVVRSLKQQTYIELAPTISAILTNAYSVHKVPGMGFRFYMIQNPGSEHQRIQRIAEETMGEVKKLWGYTRGDVAIGVLRGYLEEYDKALEQKDMDPDLRFMCLYNASVIALVIDEFDRSVGYYKEYVKIDTAAGYPIIAADKNSPAPVSVMKDYYYRSFIGNQDLIHMKLRMEL